VNDWVHNSDDFNKLVQSILEGQEAGGHETAEAAAARFASGIRIVEEGPFPAAVVSHGRILTSWLTSRGYVDEPFEFWRGIPMPGWALIDLDAAQITTPFASA
jgi:broad specificity phosphatase PhoE